MIETNTYTVGNGLDYRTEMQKAAIAVCKSALSKLYVVLLDECSVSTMDLLDDIEDDIHDVGVVAYGNDGADDFRVRLTAAYRLEFGTNAQLSTLCEIIGACNRFKRGLKKYEQSQLKAANIDKAAANVKID